MSEEKEYHRKLENQIPNVDGGTHAYKTSNGVGYKEE
jgi:hypothetical protein